MATGPQLVNAKPLTEKRIRLSALLTCIGLTLLLLTLVRVHPLAFVTFAVIACPVTLAGILLFLYSIVSHHPDAS